MPRALPAPSIRCGAMPARMWIDTHCHLDAPEFDADRDAVAAAARAAGVHCWVLPAVEAAHFSRVRALAARHEVAYALGIHPLYVDRADDEDLDRLRQALATRATTRAWWPWARSASTTSCPGWTRAAGALLPRPAQDRPRRRVCR
jgi:hypothetical protein